MKILPGVLILVLLSGCSQFGGSGNNVNLTSILYNISLQLPQIVQMLSGVCYLAGMYFIARGIFAFKAYGEGSVMMSSGRSVKVPVIYMMVGVALLFSPSTISVAMQTVFMQSNPMTYPTGSPTGVSIYNSVLLMVQTIGFISFIRGWFKLSHPTQQGAQSQFGSAMTHIIGGLCAMNIGGVINILQNTITNGGVGY